MDNSTGVDDYTLKVAAVLRRHYKATGKSYTQLAEATGLARATVERILNGKREANTRYLDVLCKEFGVTPGSVLNEADES